jgi:hypothetical protein
MSAYNIVANYKYDLRQARELGFHEGLDVEVERKNNPFFDQDIPANCPLIAEWFAGYDEAIAWIAKMKEMGALKEDSRVE